MWCFFSRIFFGLISPNFVCAKIVFLIIEFSPSSLVAGLFVTGFFDALIRKSWIAELILCYRNNMSLKVSAFLILSQKTIEWRFLACSWERCLLSSWQDPERWQAESMGPRPRAMWGSGSPLVPQAQHHLHFNFHVFRIMMAYLGKCAN